MKPITFFVPGICKPAGSKRAFALKKGGVYTGRTVVVDDCKKSRDWKTDVQYAARAAYTGPAMEGPFIVNLDFRMDRPKSHYRTGKNAGILRSEAPRFPIGKPDIDKLSRAIMDSLTHIIFRDDAQVVSKLATKNYGTPGVHINLEQIQ